MAPSRTGARTGGRWRERFPCAREERAASRASPCALLARGCEPGALPVQSAAVMRAAPVCGSLFFRGTDRRRRSTTREMRDGSLYPPRGKVKPSGRRVLARAASISTRADANPMAREEFSGRCQRDDGAPCLA
jgi:hypothetical protein